MAAFALSLALGVPLGVAITSFRVVDKLINPLLVLSRGIPEIELAPVLLAWFGFGFRASLAIGFLIAVFPIVVNTVLGIKGLDPAIPLLGSRCQPHAPASSGSYDCPQPFRASSPG